MNPARKSDPSKVLRRMAEDAQAEAEMERLLALSDEEVEQQLVADGFDLDKVRADAAAMPEKLAALAAKEADAARANPVAAVPAAPIPFPFYRRHPVLLLVAAATLTLAGVGAALALRGDIPFLRQENGPSSPREKTPEQKQAAVLRQEARTACELQDAVTCGAKLEEARLIDPAGEKTAEVVETRRMLDALPVPNEKSPGPR